MTAADVNRVNIITATPLHAKPGTAATSQVHKEPLHTTQHALDGPMRDVHAPCENTCCPHPAQPHTRATFYSSVGCRCGHATAGQKQSHKYKSVMCRICPCNCERALTPAVCIRLHNCAEAHKTCFNCQDTSADRQIDDPKTLPPCVHALWPGLGPAEPGPPPVSALLPRQIS